MVHKDANIVNYGTTPYGKQDEFSHPAVALPCGWMKEKSNKIGIPFVQQTIIITFATSNLKKRNS